MTQLHWRTREKLTWWAKFLGRVIAFEVDTHIYMRVRLRAINDEGQLTLKMANGEYLTAYVTDRRVCDVDSLDPEQDKLI
jgi:hypothetical protein